MQPIRQRFHTDRVFILPIRKRERERERERTVSEILQPIAQGGCINTVKKIQDRGRYAGLVVFGIERGAMDCGALSPIQTKYLKISNIHRLYTRLYTYIGVFYFISKYLKISTLQILTIKAHFINVY